MELKTCLLLLLFDSALLFTFAANAVGSPAIPVPTPPVAAGQAKPSPPPPASAQQPPPVAAGQAKPSSPPPGAAQQPPPVAAGQAKPSPPSPVAAPAKPPGVAGPSQAPKAGPSQPPKANSPISVPPQANSPKASSPKANSPAGRDGSPVATPSKSEDDGAAPAPGPSSDDRHTAFVLGTHMKKGASEAESAVEFITKRIQEKGEEGAEMECLHQCEDNYRSMVDAFKKASEDFSDNDFGFVGDDLSAIVADMEACQHCYKEKANGTPSPLAKFEEAIKKATDDSLAILQKSS